MTIINESHLKEGNKHLEDHYKKGYIPKEKKPYLSKHTSSSGPFLAVEGAETGYILDAASQIATLGLGFNSSVFMGNSHFIESFTHDCSTETIQQLIDSYHKFFERKTNIKNLDLTFCNSGAEANEIALGHAYKNRAHQDANKVLAFEGSFHGRMLISLSSTWNPSKRASFEWNDHKSIYCKYPTLNSDNIELEAPSGWHNFWADTPLNKAQYPEDWNKNEQLKSEVSSLIAVREQIQTGKIFAVIIEPMQCEGGDRYSSGRFHQALYLLLKSYNIALIYDEVQTGFHLGSRFFWHKLFNLKNLDGSPGSPDYVTCAKKAQIGIVISKERQLKTSPDNFQVSSLIRGYHHAYALDGQKEIILKLEKRTKQSLVPLVAKYSKHIHSPRAKGLCFAIDIHDEKLIPKLVQVRFKYGLLYYPAGSNTLRFRINTAYKKEHIEFLFDQLDHIFSEIFHKKITQASVDKFPKIQTMEKSYSWHQYLSHLRIRQAKSLAINEIEQLKKTKDLFKQSTGLDLIEIDSKNFGQYKDDIIRIEETTYEEARRTDIQNFEDAAKNEHSICFGGILNGELVSILFSAPLHLFPNEKSLRADPHFYDKESLYMLDTTVLADHHGKGIGKYLKYAMTAIALTRGIHRIQGRNRDKMASSMLNINLSLGGYEQSFIRNNYNDELKYRDVIYYTIPLKHNQTKESLKSAYDSQFSLSQLDDSSLEKLLPLMNNKICLSNFVSKSFLKDVEYLFSLAPKSLRKGYTTSGQSECVDKIIKSIWYASPKKRTKLLSFQGHFFGKGSFLSRSLSGEESIIESTILDHPTDDNSIALLEQIEEKLSSSEYLAIFIEPLPQYLMKKVPTDFLAYLRKICETYGTKLVFNETTSSFNRFSENHFYASSIPEITPDASMNFLGGSGGIVYVQKDIFLEKPLMMISTWDGDEFSFASYVISVRDFSDHKKKRLNQRNEFSKKLTKILQEIGITHFEIDGATGYIIGNLPLSLGEKLLRRNERYLINANSSDISKYLKDES